MMQIKQLLMTNEQYMECAMIWKQSLILSHNWVKTFLELHLQFCDPHFVKINFLPIYRTRATITRSWLETALEY